MHINYIICEDDKTQVVSVLFSSNCQPELRIAVAKKCILE